MEDWLRELDDSEMALALFALSAGFALLVHTGDAHVKVVESSVGWFPIAVEFGVIDLNHSPPILN